jgi:hypothetical protein
LVYAKCLYVVAAGSIVAPAAPLAGVSLAVLGHVSATRLSAANWNARYGVCVFYPGVKRLCIVLMDCRGNPSSKPDVLACVSTMCRTPPNPLAFRQTPAVPTCRSLWRAPGLSSSLLWRWRQALSATRTCLWARSQSLLSTTPRQHGAQRASAQVSIHSLGAACN